MLKTIKNAEAHLLRFIVSLAALFILTGCQTIKTYLAIPDNHRVLFWSQDKREGAFTQMEKHSEVAVIPASSTVSPLPVGKPLVFDEGEMESFFETQHIAGLIVLEKGEIRYEKYARSLDREKRWSSFSLAKSMTSTLIGMAIKDGYIDSVQSQLVQYIPELKGTVYDGVTIEHLITMTTGVGWSENYKASSDVAQFIIHKAPDGGDSTISYMSQLERVAPPGQIFNYNTGEANLAGILVKKATGRSISEYLSEKIWKPYGMEADALWALNEDGVEIGGCCVAARLRDFARYGQFIMDGGTINGRSVVPVNWVEEATSVQTSFDERAGYGYLWWTFHSGIYGAEGIFGQHMRFFPEQDILIVTLSNWPSAVGSEEVRRNRKAMYSNIFVNIHLDKSNESARYAVAAR